MTTALATFDPAALAAALKRTSREGGTASSFLKMEKSGEWTFGIDADEVAEADEFLIHPQGFVHGYVAWESDNGGSKLGEIMGPVTEAIPPTGPVPEGAGGWQFQLGMGLVASDGATLLYRATSVGGKRAIAQLAAEVAGKLGDAKGAFVPVVTLASESYKHKKYGKIYNPVITVQRWTTIPALEKLINSGAVSPAGAPAKALPAPAAAKKAVKK